MVCRMKLRNEKRGGGEGARELPQCPPSLPFLGILLDGLHIHAAEASHEHCDRVTELH